MRTSPEASAGDDGGAGLRQQARQLAAVAIASSAGGLPALSRVVAALPAGLPATVVVLQHLDPRHPSRLAEILARRTALPVSQVEEGTVAGHGAIYVAPPGLHTVFGPDGTLALDSSPPVQFVRPSADMLFASLAERYGERAVAVVLTGSGSDGAAGARAVKEHGGTVIAQDEETSEYYAMPAAAIQGGSVDLVLPLDEIAPAIVRLVT